MRFIVRWIIRLAIAGLGVGVVTGHSWLSVGVGWLAFGYLFFRAWPAIRNDVRRIWHFGKGRATSGMARF